MMINGPGGAPQVDFSVTSQDCDVFPGTQLKNCPKIGDDIEACQSKGKTILLSIGGATYSEGGFKSEEDAKAGAKLMWETFGPAQANSNALRPFGNATLDGFDFDFESPVTHMATFANELRTLMDQDTSRQYFLTAAPQCPYPDQADKDILNGPVSVDAIFVQFYNNYCGVNNFNADASSSQYNFETWDNWAKTVSQNKKVKVLLGVPADTTAASTGYVPAAKLAEIIEYTKKFESFGGVMMWDVTQGYANTGFIESVRKALGDIATGTAKPEAAPTATAAPNTTEAPAPLMSTSTSMSTKTSTTKKATATTMVTSTSSSSATMIDQNKPANDADDANAPANGSDPTTSDQSTNSDGKESGEDLLSKGPLNLVGQDLLGLLHGLRQANTIASGLKTSLRKGSVLRRARRMAALH
ncbi:putative chitinase [Penicillium oxalicum 114-2]|uniref:chitinase n=1 Tax=Penicillium oxalicum (strain 114-2 / CGMCC 5302) TaxID=933388 RepID=S7ZVS9_PENO1|nr:putative chitinase [Penicillium oxalicum 114-2]